MLLAIPIKVFIPFPVPILIPVLFPPPGYKPMSKTMSQPRANFMVTSMPESTPESMPESRVNFMVTPMPSPMSMPESVYAPGGCCPVMDRIHRVHSLELCLLVVCAQESPLKMLTDYNSELKFPECHTGHMCGSELLTSVFLLD